MKMRLLLLAATGVCVLTLTAVPAAAFTEFVQKQPKSGHQTKGGKQVFKTKAGTVECEEEKGSGGSIGEKYSQDNEEVSYEKCSAFGLIEAKLSPIKYNFHAKGTLSVESVLLVKMGECEVEINPTGNKELSGITYTNTSTGITISAAISGLTYKVNKNGGGLCGTVGSATNGEYIGAAKTSSQAIDCYYLLGGAYLDKGCGIYIIFFGFYEKGQGYDTLQLQ